MPWMKVLRKPRLNRAVVRVAVDTAANFSRLLSLSDLFSLGDMATPFSSGRLRPPGGLSILVAKRLGLYTSAESTQRHMTEQRHGGDGQAIRRIDPRNLRSVLGSPHL